MEWRPDVDGKMGKNWIPLKQLIFCSLLILVGATKHDSRVGDIAKTVWLNITLLSNFFYLLVVPKLDTFSSYHQYDLVGHVLDGASSQVCLVFLGSESSFPVPLLPMKLQFQTQAQYIAFLVGDLDYFHLLPLVLE